MRKSIQDRRDGVCRHPEAGAGWRFCAPTARAVRVGGTGKRNAVELAQAKAARESEKGVAAKDAEIQELKTRLDAEDVARKLAVTQALSAVEKERDTLANELELAKQDRQNAVELAEARAASELQKDVAAKDAEIQALKAKLGAGEAARKLAVSEAVCDVEKERDTLATELDWLNRISGASSN